MWDVNQYGYLIHYLAWWFLLATMAVHTWCFFKLFPRHRRRTRLIVGNSLITLCTLIVLGIAGETYFRFAYVGTDSCGMTGPSMRWLARYVTTNRFGFRDHEWTTPKPADVLRVAFVGDSFTMGFGIERVEERFSGIIASRLAQEGRPIEVVTLARGGWETGDQLDTLGALGDSLEIDEVVLCYCINDIDDLLAGAADITPVYPPATSLINIRDSFLLEFLYLRIVAPRMPGVYD